MIYTLYKISLHFIKSLISIYSGLVKNNEISHLQNVLELRGSKKS